MPWYWILIVLVALIVGEVIGIVAVLVIPKITNDQDNNQTYKYLKK